MKKISIVFFDIDGTLLDNKTHQISLLSKNALKQLKANGIKVIIATGRNIEDLHALGLYDLIQWDGFICRNGSDNYDGKANSISRFFFPLSVSNQLNEISMNLQIPLTITTANHRYMNMVPDSNVIDSFAYFNKVVPPTLSYNQEPVVMALAFGNKDYDYADLKIPGVQVLPGFSNFADIVIEGCSKFKGVSSLCEHYNIPLTQTMAFGDALNDLEMIEGCALGIAMGQGHPDLKKIANYITKNVDKEGIHHALKHFNLI